MRIVYLSITFAVTWVCQVAADDLSKRVFSFVADDRVVCVAFDYAAGLMVTSAHCTTGSSMELSDGRKAEVYRRRDFDDALDDFEATDRDVALLIPSESKRALSTDRSPIPPGTILYLQPPSQPAIPCPLVEYHGLTLILDCYASVGLSGSPIIRVGRFGSRKVVGLLSAIDTDTRMSWATHIASVDWLTQ